jgi:hypothetical protein
MKDRFKQIIENEALSYLENDSSSLNELLATKCEALAVEMMEKFADWILKEGFERLRDGERVWWGKFTDEIDFTTRELIAKFLSDYTHNSNT